MSFLDRLDLNGRNLLVDGGATPVGRATASFAAGYGLGSLILVDDDEAGLKQASDEARELGLDVSTYVVEPGDVGRMMALKAEAESASGSIELLVNASDTPSRTRFHELERAEWDRVAVGQVKRVFATCRALVPAMAEREYGRVVNLASISAKRASEGLGGPAYATAHAAINGFTRALAREFATRGVRVNAIDSGLTESDPEDVIKDAVAAIPLGREARLSEIAATTVYLLSDASAYVTGETLNLDGGLAME